jgi:NarL family two-component system response regulator LiaR
MAMNKIRLLIIDRYPVFREGLCQLSSKEKDIECVAVAENGEEGVKLAKQLVPDVVLIDIDVLTRDDIDITKQIKAACPTAAVSILTHIKDESFIVACLRAGVNGYLLKDTPVADLMNAIRILHAGESIFNFEATASILCNVGNKKDGNQPASCQLHDREQEVLKLAARGMSNSEISSELSISQHTVATHFFNIYRKMGVQSRTEAVLHALKRGWFNIDDID